MTVEFGQLVAVVQIAGVTRVVQIGQGNPEAIRFFAAKTLCAHAPIMGEETALLFAGHWIGVTDQVMDLAELFAQLAVAGEEHAQLTILGVFADNNLITSTIA